MSALAGKRVLVTRSRAQAREFFDLLISEGAVPILFPTIEIAALEDASVLDAALLRLEAGVYNWVIFTSANAVEACADRLERLGHPASALGRALVAAIGPATAGRLQRLGVTPDFVPEDYLAERLPDGLGAVAGRRILLPCGDIARPVLADALTATGALVDRVAVYRTLQPQPEGAASTVLGEGVDVFTFTSASSVRNFVALAGPRTGTAAVACIGPVTAQTARDLGLPVHAVAKVHTVPGLVQTLKEYFNGQA